MKHGTIPTDEVAKEVGQETEISSLVAGITHAKWDRLLDYNGMWIGDCLSIIGATFVNISEVGIGEFGVE